MMKVNQNIVLKSVGVVFQSDDNLIMRTGNKLEIISRLNGVSLCERLAIWLTCAADAESFYRSVRKLYFVLAHVISQIVGI